MATRRVWILFGLMLVLCLLGLLFVGSASSYLSLRDTGDAFDLVRKQAVWFAIGLGAFFVIMIIPTSFWEKNANLIFVGCLLLMGALWTPLGVSGLGSRRWLDLGGISTLQPSEVLKIGSTIFFSALLPRMVHRNLRGWQWLVLLLLACLPVAVVLVEPDLGSAVIVAMGVLTIFYLSGAPFLKLVAGSGLLVGSFSILALVVPYVRNRVVSHLGGLLGKAADPTGIDYNRLQALYSFGSGGIWGVGFGMSRQKFQWLPMAHNDFIFAIVAEETGLWGTAILLFLYLALMYTGLNIALHSQSMFTRLLAGGLTSMLGWQAVVHIAVSSGLLPITGITLPFISYGGSSLLISMSCCGILARIAWEEAQAEASQKRVEALRRVRQETVIP